MSIAAALDDLAARIQETIDIPATRDPQKARSLVAGGGLAAFIRPPEPDGAGMCGLRWEVPISLLMPTPGGLTELDRALNVLPALLALLGEHTAYSGPVTVGETQLPAYTIDKMIGA